MPEAPVCTCISLPIPATSLRLVRVFDPYCQVKSHRENGTYAGPEPSYG